MLGGAIGTIAGLFSGSALLNGALGGVWGFTCSVPLSILLMALTQFLTITVGSDIEDAPIGCSTTSQLSGSVGAITGFVGAVILTYTARGNHITDSQNFAVCWTTSAAAAITLMLVIVFRSRITARYRGNLPPRLQRLLRQLYRLYYSHPPPEKDDT